MGQRKLPPKANKRPSRRSRRSTGEIIGRILEAAGNEFEHRGYVGAKTAAIARRASVAEALIFSNFGSKAKLFNDSVFQPLERHLREFCAAHLVAPGDADGLREGTRQYILELRQFIGRHSRMFKSLVAAQMYASDNVRSLSQIEGLNDFFSRATELAGRRLVGRPRIDPKLLTRVSFATVLACVLFKDWLLPEDLASESEITAAINDFVMDGLNANEGREAAPPVARRSARAVGRSRSSGRGSRPR